MNPFLLINNQKKKKDIQTHFELKIPKIEAKSKKQKRKGQNCQNTK
jgi:hypothetical protein